MFNLLAQECSDDFWVHSSTLTKEPYTTNYYITRTELGVYIQDSEGFYYINGDRNNRIRFRTGELHFHNLEELDIIKITILREGTRICFGSKETNASDWSKELVKLNTLDTYKVFKDQEIVKIYVGCGFIEILGIEYSEDSLVTLTKDIEITCTEDSDLVIFKRG